MCSIVREFENDVIISRNIKRRICETYKNWFQGARENNSMFELWYNNSDKLGSVSRSANKLIQIKWFKKILSQGLLYYLE